MKLIIAAREGAVEEFYLASRIRRARLSETLMQFADTLFELVDGLHHELRKQLLNGHTE
jgi:hypothetical protein